MEGYGGERTLVLHHTGLGLAEGCVYFHGLGCSGHVDDCLCQIHLYRKHKEEVDRVI